MIKENYYILFKDLKDLFVPNKFLLLVTESSEQASPQAGEVLQNEAMHPFTPLTFDIFWFYRSPLPVYTHIHRYTHAHAHIWQKH